MRAFPSAHLSINTFPINSTINTCISFNASINPCIANQSVHFLQCINKSMRFSIHLSIRAFPSIQSVTIPQYIYAHQALFTYMFPSIHLSIRACSSIYLHSSSIIYIYFIQCIYRTVYFLYSHCESVYFLYGHFQLIRFYSFSPLFHPLPPSCSVF
jgi:hypothetical protein